jgi:hypothetical protein
MGRVGAIKTGLALLFGAPWTMKDLLTQNPQGTTSMAAETKQGYYAVPAIVSAAERDAQAATHDRVQAASDSGQSNLL